MKFSWRSHLDSSKNPLGLVEIIVRFTAETLLTALIYTILVLVTIVLGHIERLATDKNTKVVLEFLESLIFYSSSFIVVLVVVYLTVITAVEMSRSFRKTILEEFRAPGTKAKSPNIAWDQVAEGQSEYSSIKLRSNLLIKLIIYILPLSLLIGVGCYQRGREQVLREELKRQAEYSRHVNELNSSQATEKAAEKFITTCARGNGVFEANTKVCIFPDGQSYRFTP